MPINKLFISSRWLSLIPLLLLGGCAQAPVASQSAPVADNSIQVTGAPAENGSVPTTTVMPVGSDVANVPLATPKLPDQPAHLMAPVYDPIVSLVQNMLVQMELNNQEVSGMTPIAVTSFVDLGSLGRTDSLGRQLSESFGHELHQSGFSVVEYKATGTIKVTGQGDFALSRNLADLQREQNVDYVLAGTINQQHNGLMVNARLVNLKTKLIAASAQGFIPAQILQPIQQQGRMYRAREGMLIRESGYSMRPVSLR